MPTIAIQVVAKFMSIQQYFKLSSAFPTLSETGIGVIATDETNAAVQKELDGQSYKGSKKNARSVLPFLPKLVLKLVPKMAIQQP